MKQLLGLLTVILCFAFSLSAQEANAVLQQDEIKIGEQTTIDLEIRVSAASELILPELKDTISKFIQVVHVSNIDTTFDQDDITIKIFTQRITITSFDSGFHAIPPFRFLVNGQPVNTSPLLLTVKTIPIQAEQDIRDIKNIEEVPFSLSDWIISNRNLLGSVLLLIVLIIIGIYLIKRLLQKEKTPTEVVIPKEDADIVASRKLQQLEQEKLWQNGKVKEYYSQLSFITREYIENRFELHALEQTTEEIMALMQVVPQVDKAMNAKLRTLLSTADMAKFAKQQPVASENEEVLKIAHSFVAQTAIEKESKEVGTENTAKDA